MLVTNWIRAAVAGKTADGREIVEQHLIDAGGSYSQAVYNARIWPEHIRGVLPDGFFKALGDVVQAKAERIKTGALAGKMALYVKLAPHADLIAMVRNGQKVHLSVEIDPDFADTSGAYLMGVGVTDSPASLGTGMMKFSTNERKNNLFTALQEADIQEPTTTQNADYTLQFAQLQGQNNALMQQFNSLKADVATLLEEVSLLKANQQETHTIIEEIGNTSAGRFKRSPATGGGYSRTVDY